MFFARRTALLRLTAMSALVASAVLTADALHPERAFCPLEQACDAARESALGSVLGVPTSLLGMLAFGGLFLLTLLPVEWSRSLLRPAGALAALAGVGFVAYQALVLHTYCPLCLVADVAGFVAGVITLSWPAPPVRLSGKRLPGEALPRRVAWTVAASLAVLAPFVWPRPEAPAWVEITPLADADLLFEATDPTATEAASTAPAATHAHGSAARAPSPGHALPPARWAGDPASATGRPPTPPTPPERPAAAAVHAAHAAPTLEPTATTAALTTAPPPPTATPAPPAPTVQPVRVVEYLNAYCQHCRATHQRLEDVLAQLDHPVQVRRIYTWGGQGYPLWARACVFAATQGLEDAMFRELLKSRRESPQEIRAAAQRAGVDAAGLEQALRATAVPSRLERDATLMRSARLQGLPTLDIGRRRLMGAQSEAELTGAMRAAVADLRVTLTMAPPAPRSSDS